MDKKLIDYEGFEAYSKGVKNKYAEKKDIITPNERKYIQLENDGFELTRYQDVEATIGFFISIMCRLMLTTVVHDVNPIYHSLIDLCLDNDCKAKRIAKDKRYVENGFLGVLQKGWLEFSDASKVLVKSHEGKNLTVEEISTMWKQKNESPLIWVNKDILAELKSKLTMQTTLDLSDLSYVKQEKGKGLSSNDYTNEDQAKVYAIPANPKYTDTIPDLSGYATKESVPTRMADLQEDTTHRTVTDTEKTAINNSFSKFEELRYPGNGNVEFIFTNNGGGTQRIPISTASTRCAGLMSQFDKRKLNNIQSGANKITKLSELENDKTFKTETEIQQMISNASSLKKEVVTSLPTTGKDDVIYLVKDDKGKDNNNYLEYLWLNGKYELIGSTQVDLSGYATKESLTQVENFTRSRCDSLGVKFDRFSEGLYSHVDETVAQGVKSATVDIKSSIEDCLKKQDIQEFTQQELEEAFK